LDQEAPRARRDDEDLLVHLDKTGQWVFPETEDHLVHWVRLVRLDREERTESEVLPDPLDTLAPVVPLVTKAVPA
jgi:desulfoferrodoxin (superoxide reductase-like protein)